MLRLRRCPVRTRCTSGTSAGCAPMCHLRQHSHLQRFARCVKRGAARVPCFAALQDADPLQAERDRLSLACTSNARLSMVQVPDEHCERSCTVAEMPEVCCKLAKRARHFAAC